MNRREFVFSSLKAAVLLSPVFSIRRAEAAISPPKRAFFWVSSAGYPDEPAFFPTGTETNFTLSPILAGLQPVKENLVVLENVDIRNSGFNAAGANHARAPGKILTAKDVIDDGEEGVPGGPSIDQFLVQQLNLTSLELHVTQDYARSIREKPFASGPNAFKPPVKDPAAVWDKVFNGFMPNAEAEPERQARLLKLRSRKSLLDGMRSDLKKLRGELNGVEKLKLDIHEDAIRTSELSVAADLGNVPPPSAQCTLPARGPSTGDENTRSKALFDVMYAAYCCNRAQVGGMVWGGSGFSFRYNWIPNTDVADLHNDVHHNAQGARDLYIRCANWDWTQLGNFVLRLRNTPEGDGTLLDSAIVLGCSHFSNHHDIRKLPMVLFGTKKGGLNAGRYLKLASTINNDRVLTSVANLMGVPATGFGDEQNCGPVPGL